MREIVVPLVADELSYLVAERCDCRLHEGTGTVTFSLLWIGAAVLWGRNCISDFSRSPRTVVFSSL
ncbi:hypothetical protein SAMN02799620_02904 [Mycolicibacterium fluoranthenivorans]|uniref:Uncharacterized protein n=1 Tax=Mycolicibacterium fluoranthenivorans TaxID=258505 RepID=A0A1G4WCN1_9MYCO|nr:hypothetical protein SAMN02799620_02904 [Mycolicibacterium fluoranthenivorans]